MRILVIVVATCLVCTRAAAQTVVSTPIGPATDYQSAADSDEPIAESGREDRDLIRERWSNGPTPRYITYVVDSQFVLLADQSAADSASRNPLSDLAVTDIVGIYATKEKSLPDSLRTCPGVPGFLILTKSRRWRPRVAETRAPNKRCPVAAA